MILSAISVALAALMVDSFFWSRRSSSLYMLQAEVNLAMVPHARVGDYVLVHVGVAIGVVDEAEALLTLQHPRQIGELHELGDGA